MTGLLAVLLPMLLWDKTADSAPLLRRANISEIAVAPALSSAWRAVPQITVHELNPDQLTALPAPALTYDVHTASATRAAWVHLNGWRFLRQPDAAFRYHVEGRASSLAAAEAFSYGAKAAVQTDEAGLQPLAGMLGFLANLPSESRQPRTNIAYIDDGSPQSGEFMNMLVRRNLLFTVATKPDPGADLTVSLNDPDYPKSELVNPKLLAEKVRGNLTDEKRLLRIYGSETVIGRLTGSPRQSRLFLLNYGAAKNAVPGLRIRVLGHYKQVHAYADGQPQCILSDVNTGSDAAEFTLPLLNTLAVVDLTQ